MTDALATDERVLAPTALERQATFDLDFLARQTTALVTALGWVFGGPPLLSKYSLAALLDLPPLAAVQGYLDYYSTHLTVLARILASVQKAEPVDRAITELEKNVETYTAKANEVARRARRDIQPSPFATIPAGTAFVAVLGAPYLSRNREFVAAWNTHLGIYQVLVENAVEVARYHAQQGDAIIQETLARAPELRGAIEEIKAKISLDVVIKLRYEERLNRVELDLRTRVQDARAAARDIVPYLEQGPLAEARRAQRL
jgi:hypothetical protein